jgi:hypothetical protein
VGYLGRKEMTNDVRKAMESRGLRQDQWEKQTRLECENRLAVTSV